MALPAAPRSATAPPACAAGLAIVLVHYHTPQLAVAALAALRQEVDRLTPPLDAAKVEWLLVDNGSDAAGRALLAGLPVRLLEPGRNLGYAGGVNLGVASSSAEHILLMNPDVLVLPGCLAGLLGCLRSGAAAAGPRFYWDTGKHLLLPPAETRSRRGELLTWLATTRGGAWAAWGRRRSRRHCRRHWLATAPLRSYTLSGSLLAVTRSAWNHIGGFDDEYRLYFEETDWLLRLRRAGLPAWFVPAAEAVHLYARSAVAEPRAQSWFAESERRFRRRHYGAWFAAALDGLDRRGRRAAPAGRAVRPAPVLPAVGLDLGGRPRPLWIEVSPNPTGFPAAAEEIVSPDPAGRWLLPAEVRDRLGGPEGLEGGAWQVWLSDRAAGDLARFSLVETPGA